MAANVIVVDDPTRLAHRSVLSRVTGKGWIVWALVLAMVALWALFPSFFPPFDPTKQKPIEKFLAPFESGST